MNIKDTAKKIPPEQEKTVILDYQKVIIDALGIDCSDSVRADKIFNRLGILVTPATQNQSIPCVLIDCWWDEFNVYGKELRFFRMPSRHYDLTAIEKYKYENLDSYFANQ